MKFHPLFFDNFLINSDLEVQDNFGIIDYKGHC